MRVVYSEAHEAHAPETFISCGVVSPSPETPERAARLLAYGFLVADELSRPIQRLDG